MQAEKSFRPRKPGLQSSSTLKAAVANEPDREELTAQGIEEMSTSGSSLPHYESPLPPESSDPPPPTNLFPEGSEEEMGDSLEAEGDLVMATQAFSESVQTITEALMLILGKFKGVHKKQELVTDAVDGMLEKQRLVNRSVNAFAFFGLMILAAMAFVTYRMEMVTEEVAKDQRTLGDMLTRIKSSEKKLTTVAKKQEQTNVKVSAVQKAAAGRSDIRIVADLDGGAKVVIETPDPEPPLGPLDAGAPPPSTSSSAPRPKTTVEIPVKLPPGSKAFKRKEELPSTP